jgi:hypothetical protein
MSFFSTTGNHTPVDLTAATEALYQDVAEELIRAITAIQAGEIDQIPNAKAAVKELRATFLIVLEERNKVEKLRKHVAGAVGTGTLDLSAARDEIGRRLALLRNAG